MREPHGVVLKKEDTYPSEFQQQWSHMLSLLMPGYKIRFKDSIVVEHVDKLFFDVDGEE